MKTKDRAVKVGIIGCGNISAIYMKRTKVFSVLDVVACADLDPQRAQARAAEFAIPNACTVAEILADPQIELIVNLTIPAAHVSVSKAALEAGKHVYSEKPLGTELREGAELIAAAQSRGLRVGCAPDTVLGAGIQTCRKLIDDGVIGRPIGATAFMMCHGHESWHPDPEFYYKKGGGPMFDMGPYYLTALITLLGPASRVTASARASFPHRTITSQPKAGSQISVDVPTHISSIIDFFNGAIGTVVMSFDVWGHEHPLIEIYGSEGTLSVPDPNSFGGPVRVKAAGSKEWRDVAYTHGYAENTRGLGVADMALAIRTGVPHRASGDLALHVLEIMESVHVASNANRHVDLTTTCTQPQPMPGGLAEGDLE